MKKAKDGVWEMGLTNAQKKLRRKHGFPPEFAAACYHCVPEFISMTEARTAVEKYQREWDAARPTRRGSLHGH